MPSMEINQCDLRCPAISMLVVGNRLATAEASPLGEAARNTLNELRRICTVGRAALTCDTRRLDEDTWYPSDTCVARAQRAADKLGPLTANDITERERNNLWAADIDVE
jgi:hypothetical protein